MKKSDGSSDDWHEQKIASGGSFADIFLACPASLAGIVLVFIIPGLGYYLLAFTAGEKNIQALLLLPDYLLRFKNTQFVIIKRLSECLTQLLPTSCFPLSSAGIRTC